MGKSKLMREVEERVGVEVDSYLRKSYVDDGKSIYKMADELSVSASKIRVWMDDYNISRRSIGESLLMGRAVKPTREEFEKYCNIEKKSFVGIGKECGVCSATISRWVKEYGIEIGNMPEKKILEEMYVEGGMSISEIGRRYSVGRSTAGRWFAKYNIKGRVNHENYLGFEDSVISEWKEMYASGNNLNIIGEKFGVCPRTIASWLEKKGVVMRSKSEAKLIKRGVVIPSRDELEIMYVKEKMSKAAISRRIGVCHTTVNRWIREYEIKRDMKSKMLEDFLKGYVGG